MCGFLASSEHRYILCGFAADRCDQIIPAFVEVARTSAARVQVFHLEQLTILVGIIKTLVRKYTIGIFELISDLWENQSLQLPLASLVEALGKALDVEFKPFLPNVLPLLLKVFDNDMNDKVANTQMKVFNALLTFGANIEEYLQLFVPILVKTFERPDGPLPLRKRAIQTAEGLTRRVNFSDHASRIIHPLVRVLGQPYNELRQAAMDCLCAFMLQLGSDFVIFVSTINKVRSCVLYGNSETNITTSRHLPSIP